MALDVEIYADGNEATPRSFEVDFVSFINDETYGKPPLVVSDDPARDAVARKEDEVLYINTSRVAIVKVTKL